MTVNNSYELFKEKKELHNLSENRPVIIADNIMSPMNVGAILRLAANINAAKVWFVHKSDPGFRLYKIKRTSSGASEKVDWKIITHDVLPEVLPEDYTAIAIETTEDSENIYDTKLPEKVIFIVGNERYGISDEVLQYAHKKVFIPVPGVISSINVSHALAVSLFEWYRQEKQF